MQFEFDLKNLAVPIAQYRYFNFERPSKHEVDGSKSLLGKRDIFSHSLLCPAFSEK